MPMKETDWDAKLHWEGVYSRNASDRVSWYRPHLDTSLQLIRSASVPDASVIDVGGGHATLVDDLLRDGYCHLTVLDISESALECSRQRLGAAAEKVSWLAGDVLELDLPESHFDLWHDRAVFHFFTRPEQHRVYARQMLRALKPGGNAVIATFGPEGPMKCSGLDTCRYNADALARTLGSGLQWIEEVIDLHQTPSGTQQQFLYCLFRRV